MLVLLATLSLGLVLLAYFGGLFAVNIFRVGLCFSMPLVWFVICVCFMFESVDSVVALFVGWFAL